MNKNIKKMNDIKLWKKNVSTLTKTGVYNQKNEHDNCGVGLVAAIDGNPKRNVVEAGIKALKALWHRGAVDADGKTGDGAGLQLNDPQEFFKDYIRSLGVTPSKKNIAVGMIFLPRTDIVSQEICRTITEREIINSGNKIIIIKAKINTPINIQISEIISFNEIPVTAFITNNKIPYGGVINPIIEFTTTKTPKWIKSTPKALHTGINNGTITKIIVVASKKHPKSKTKMLIKIKNIKGLTSNPCKNIVNAPGIFSLITI